MTSRMALSFIRPFLYLAYGSGYAWNVTIININMGDSVRVSSAICFCYINQSINQSISLLSHQFITASELAC